MAWPGLRDGIIMFGMSANIDREDEIKLSWVLSTITWKMDKKS